MTLTICIDKAFIGFRPRLYSGRVRGRLFGLRVTWLWVAVAWHRIDDHEPITTAFGWIDD